MNVEWKTDWKGFFSDSDCSDDEEGAPSFGLTQEIDSAVDRVMSSLSGGGGRGHCGRSWEDFPAENLLGWEKNTTPGLLARLL